MLWMLIVMVLAFWLMSRFARKQQEKMTAQQNARIEEAMVPGTWVRTRAGFYGKVVEVDGEVVTLATALGDESLWAKASILGAEEPPSPPWRMSSPSWPTATTWPLTRRSRTRWRRRSRPLLSP